MSGVGNVGVLSMLPMGVAIGGSEPAEAIVERELGRSSGDVNDDEVRVSAVQSHHAASEIKLCGRRVRTRRRHKGRGQSPVSRPSNAPGAEPQGGAGLSRASSSPVAFTAPH